jgi:hypothetical protein
LKRAGHDRIRFLEHIVFEHMHHRLGKSSCDATYKNRKRFGDDLTFTRLLPMRVQGAVNLQKTIECDTLSFPQAVMIKKQLPTSLFGIIAFSARLILSDTTLTLQDRAELFCRQMCRLFASKVIR